MSTIIKLGSTGELVKDIQEVIGIIPDGIFGKKTESAVKEWQLKNNLKPDGIIGPVTLGRMGLLDTDISQSKSTFSDKSYLTKNGLTINEFFIPKNEYNSGPIKPEYLFLHHTAGWHNPYNTIKQWVNDNRGEIATEFVIGGQSVKGNDNDYDGVVLQSFPKGNWGYHLGKNGNSNMHKNSVGIEVCNFGYIVDGKTYSNTQVDASQIVSLSKPFRGFKEWHRYSDSQIESLKKLILWIGERDNIDVRDGLPKLIKTKGVDAFEFNNDAYFGRVKGLWTHTNTRKDKFDMFPQQELIDMLLSL